ncbi:uncharacterized protein LOC125371134 [Ricinus communis]|uniref:uncharacterized protein LOC125371134 n=1 Tax=Ricinus communis TaxID=3988 RepID=UPI00201A2C3E|nr:uncharacterized protein LOC125371134 [Ricinus communis]XP_048235450.1 uncharacterized protein LOC125371134 [Ricinus communis]
MTCTCRRWDLTGIPCYHTVCAIWYNNENPEFYIHDFYKVETYLKCYSHLINPTTSKKIWPKATAPPVLSPKPIKPRKGRPARKRRLEEEEMEGLIINAKVTKKGSVMTCTVCGAKGHNKRFHGAGASIRREKLLVKRKTKKQQKEKESNAATIAAQNVDDQPDNVATTDTAPLGRASTFDNLSPLIPLSQLFNVTLSAKESEKPPVHSTTSLSKPTSKKSKNINDLLSELPLDLAIGSLSET